MSLKNLLVGLLYRYKLVKQAVLNEYVKEARQRQLQYQQQIQQLINLHKADSMVKKANLLNNLYQQALLAKLAAEDEAIRGSGVNILDPVKKFVGKLWEQMKQLPSGEGGGGGGSEGALSAGAGDPGSVPSREGSNSGGGIGLPFMGLLPGQLKEKAKETAIQAWEALQKAKKDLANDSGQPDDSGLWSKVLSALNEHKGQIALGAGGGLLALLGGALLTKKLRNRKRKKNTAQTPSSDAAAAATAVEQELKDLVTSTQRQQQKKK